MTAATRVAWGLALVFALISLYGWWFHLEVGPSHGPGAEIGLGAGAAAVGCGVTGFWLRKPRGVRKS